MVFCHKLGVVTHKPALVSRPGGHTVSALATTLTLVKAFFAPSKVKAACFATVRALEECKPKRLVSDQRCVFLPLRVGRRHPEGRHREPYGRCGGQQGYH
eukprot:5028104-Amphidinium_carterae.2